MKLWNDIQLSCKKEIANQPITVLCAVFGVLALGVQGLAKIIPIFDKDGSGIITKIATTVSEVNGSIPIVLLIAVLLANYCRQFFKGGWWVGFFASLVCASICILLFSLMEKDALLKTTTFVDSRYQGPLMDMVRWSIFCIFIAILWVQGAPLDKDGQEIGILIFSFVWGAFLATGQQWIVRAYVFERPPVVQQAENPLEKNIPTPTQVR